MTATLTMFAAALLSLPLLAAASLPLAGPAAAAEALDANALDDGPTFTAAAVPQPNGRLLVQPEVGASLAAVSSALESAGVELVDRIDGLDLLVVDAPSGPAEAIAKLEASAAIAYAEPDHPVQAASRIPNDPIYPDQWGLPLINAPTAWATTIGRKDVTIAVLDTGVDPTHEDLGGAVVAGYDFVADDPDPRDEHGHGTLSAGVAAARTDNLRGGAGVCWACTVLAVRVLDEHGNGTVSDVVAGIRFAADAGAEIITLSLGSPTPSASLASAVDYADGKGSLLIASAGNFGHDQPTERVYPAAHDKVVGVAGSDEHDRRYEWSTHGSWVSLAAPGCNVATHPGDQPYRWYCGTSSAAPVVAGVAGLALAKYPTATNAQLRTALNQGATPVSFVAHGRVEATGTLAVLEALGLTAAPIVEDTKEPSGDEPLVSPARHEGKDRYETAARAVTATFDEQAGRVYIATGSDFPDALAAGPAAAAGSGPVLLTRPDALPEPTAAALTALAPAEIVVVGGRNAVSNAVLEEVRALTGTMPARVAGPDRYATASAIAADAFDGPVEVVYVATGADYPDALAGTPAAAAEDAPMLLTARAGLPPATRDALNDLAPERIVVLGGKGAVADAVLDEIREATGVEPRRVAGADRYETAAKVGARAYPDSAVIGVLATGTNFPDALAGGPVAAHIGGPLLLVRPDALPRAAADVLRDTAPPMVLALGGSGVVSDATLAAAVEAATIGQNQRD